MFEPSKPNADYELMPDAASIGMVTAILPAPTPEQLARREEIWKFCNAITWREIRRKERERRSE